MTRPLFLMLVGLPAAGKSTFVEERRAAGANFVHLSTDAIIEQWAAERRTTYDRIWADSIKGAERAMYDDYQRAVSERRDTVLDRTNLTPKRRRGFLAPLPKEYRKIAVVFEVPEALRQQRLLQRPGKSIPVNVDEHMRASYIRPTEAEGFEFVIDYQHSYLATA